MYICVDFDGTIVEHMYPEIGNPVPDAIEYLNEFQDLGAKLILFTMRSGDTLVQAADYIRNNGIVLYGVNVNPDQSSWTTSPKAYGQLYIDDAAVGCPLIHPPGRRAYVNWKIVGPYVKTMLGNYA